MVTLLAMLKQALLKEDVDLRTKAKRVVNLQSCYKVSGYICTGRRTYMATVDHSASLVIGQKAKFHPVTNHHIPTVYFKFATYETIKTRIKDTRLLTGWFDKCNNSPLSLKAIKDAGYERMTLVQEATLPVILNEVKDVLAKARTGTGKTVAFLSPCMMGVGTDYGNDEEKVGNDTGVRLWSMKIGTKPIILAKANAQAAKNKVTRLQSTMEPLRYGGVARP
ncbi:hypothetical protein CASFOL_008464 [Castilleja foliolosa]|uniref:ATP-dependent RNA helicase n=1 Tax=Castilleja foliolosa TaxID=1961234 RepID=A0ABD3DZ21_9LAMI